MNRIMNTRPTARVLVTYGRKKTVWNRSFGDGYQKNGIFYRLQEIGIVEQIGEIIGSHTEIGLGCEIVSLFYRVEKYIDQRVYHE